VMAPAWVAMDRTGRAITPIVTHQDRRSLEVAQEIERRVGRRRHLQMAGNRPIPGGISSTTAAWFGKHEPSVMRRADLVGHLNTFLHRQITGRRVVDLSNACFMGLYETIKLGGWNEELCEAAGVSKGQLPEILESNVMAGRVTRGAAARLGLPKGMPVMAGMIDTSGAMFLAGAKVGQLLNVSGSTDVLALCTNRPRPHERLLTRALGVGRMWLSVGTIAAAGSALDWAKQELFGDLSEREFYRLVGKLARRTAKPSGEVKCDPSFAGDRCSVEQKRASFDGLTLASTREDLLAALIDALGEASANRLRLLASRGVRLRRRVVVSGKTAMGLREVLYRDWPGNWSFVYEDEASLRGLSVVEPQ